MKKVFLLLSVMILCVSGCQKEKNPIVTMEFKDYGEIKIELKPDKAPNTVANFVNLVEEGYYDNNTVHRVVENFVLQGGDPKGDGTGGPGYAIKGEFSENGYRNNTISHTRGVISMARGDYNLDSAGGQFFIVLDDSAKASLDGKYAAFGEVIEGMDVIDKMVEDAIIENESTQKLKNNYTITKATVDTFGKEYKVNKLS